MLLSHFAAVISALLLSLYYSRSLGVTRSEYRRYLKKSVNLGLCYAGFGVNNSVREGWLAGKAGFLCCVYDVITDWRDFEAQSKQVFVEIMSSMELASELRALAIGLYETEVSNALTDDGLDRGYIALHFVLKIMNCEQEREAAWGNLNHIGRLCQIVDDVLDFEEDTASGDINCLKTSRRESHLRELVRDFSEEEVARWFGSSHSVLRIAIKNARLKAEQLLIDWESGSVAPPQRARSDASSAR